MISTFFVESVLHSTKIRLKSAVNGTWNAYNIDTTSWVTSTLTWTVWSLWGTLIYRETRSSDLTRYDHKVWFWIVPVHMVWFLYFDLRFMCGSVQGLCRSARKREQALWPGIIKKCVGFCIFMRFNFCSFVQLDL